MKFPEIYLCVKYTEGKPILYSLVYKMNIINENADINIILTRFS